MPSKKFIIGSYDDRTDFTHTNLTDEELAQRLQKEEFNPVESKIDEQPEYKQPEYKQPEYKQPEYNTNSELLRKQKQELEKLKMENQLIRERNAYTNKPINIYRPIYRSIYEPKNINDELYYWSLDLIPSYYSLLEKQKIENILKKLIKQELLLDTPKYRIQNMIRNVIDDLKSNYSFRYPNDFSFKESSLITPDRKTTRKKDTKKKPSRSKSPAKKTTKKKDTKKKTSRSKSPAKKTTKKKDMKKKDMTKN
jgi:hypothetical protein